MTRSVHNPVQVPVKAWQRSSYMVEQGFHTLLEVPRSLNPSQASEQLHSTNDTVSMVEFIKLTLLSRLDLA